MKVTVKDSPIHGKGVFALEDIPAETPVCFLCWWHPHEHWWRVNQNSVVRYINHATKNNCVSILNEDVEQYIVITSELISAGTELTLDYEVFPTGLMKATDYDPPLV